MSFVEENNAYTGQTDLVGGYNVLYTGTYNICILQLYFSALAVSQTL